MKTFRYIKYDRQTTVEGENIFIFKLLEPIKELIGSLRQPDGTPYTMTNVKKLWLYKAPTIIDKKNKIISFNCYIDISRPQLDSNGSIIKPMKAWITEFPFKVYIHRLGISDRERVLIEKLKKLQ